MKELIFGFNRCRCALAFGIFLAIAAVYPTAARADEQGYVLTQRGENFGDQYVYASANGFLFKNPRVGTGLITLGPDWNVVVYNEKSRIYYQANMTQYKSDVAIRGSGINSATQGWSWTRVSEQEKICGLPCTKYQMTGFNTIQRKNRPSMTINNGSYWVANNIAVPLEVGQLLDSMYGLPPTQRYPLRLTADEHGTPKTLMDTYRAQPATIPSSLFMVPAGLSPVINYAELYMTDQQIIADMEKEYNRRSSASSTADGTINIAGVNWDKAKLRRVINALKNAK